MMFYVFYIKDGILYSGLTVYGDYAPHTAMMRSFSAGNNFPTQYPHYGGADVKYHFMFQFLTGNLEYLGMRMDFAYNIVSTLSLVGFLMLLYQLALRITGKMCCGVLALFLFFFSLFLLTATPLILKKIPLDVFGFRRSRKIKPIPERKFIRKAQNIFRLYNINENLDPGVIPTYPEADLEDKHYIVDFLSNVIANLDSNTSLNDDFNRFGVKLVIFGGCMELARFRRLNIAQANSLLNEAFSILDGKNYEVAEFYEAKRSYQDNRVAVFLTGSAPI